MLGNEAFARGLFEAGCRIVSSYPGTPSTEITEAAAKYDEIYAEWAPNEKVAMETAIGASIAGARSFCGMKHVGLNVAADPLYTAAYSGVNGGMVIAVADDPVLRIDQKYTTLLRQCDVFCYLCDLTPGNGYHDRGIHIPEGDAIHIPVKNHPQILRTCSDDKIAIHFGQIDT